MLQLKPNVNRTDLSLCLPFHLSFYLSLVPSIDLSLCICLSDVHLCPCIPRSSRFCLTSYLQIARIQTLVLIHINDKRSVVCCVLRGVL